jgi:bifunctional non-homologous end joining protein LigD
MGRMPPSIRPMYAVLVRDLPADDDRWGYEFKWDGVRAIAHVAEEEVRVLSRNDKDITGTYPELTGLPELTGRPAVLDGEIVALRDGRPDFGLLQSRMHVQRPTERLLRSIPVEYYVFDLLYLDERLLIGEPYTDRRALLDGLSLSGQHVQTPPWFHGAGRQVLAVSLANGLEGVIAKRLESRYQPGRRSRDWLKIKNVRHQEVVIGGWKPGRGRRSDLIGSLLLGVGDDRHNGRGLEYVGHVGTGFTDAALRDLAATLRPLARESSPFATEVPREDARDAHWVEPLLVGEVAYTERTADGRLRHPSWRGLRPDKQPDEVQVEKSQ